MKMLSEHTTTTESTLKPVHPHDTPAPTGPAQHGATRRLPLWLALVTTVITALVGGGIAGSLLALIR